MKFYPDLWSRMAVFIICSDSFRWEYVKPVKSIVIAHKNSTKRYVYSDGKWWKIKWAARRQWRSYWTKSPAGLTADSIKSVIYSNDPWRTNTMITLTPAGQSMAGMIEKIEIVLSREAATVKSVKIIEDANSFTQINFQNVEINKSINPSVFQDVKWKGILFLILIIFLFSCQTLPLDWFACFSVNQKALTCPAPYLKENTGWCTP